MRYRILDRCEITTICNITSIKTVSHKDYVNTITFGCFKIYKRITIPIHIVILFYRHCRTYIFLIQKKYNLTSTASMGFVNRLDYIICPFRPRDYLKRAYIFCCHFANSNSYFCLTYTTRWGYCNPIGFTLHTPRIV